MMRIPALLAPPLLLATLAIASPVRAQDATIRETEAVPPAAALTPATTSRLHDAVTRFAIDRAALLRRHDAPYSSARRQRLREFYSGWSERLAGLPFESWDIESRIDYVLLRAELAYQLSLLQLEERRASEMAPLLPFSSHVVTLQESRRTLQPIDPPAVARTLAAIADAVDETRRGVEAGVRDAGRGDSAVAGNRPGSSGGATALKADTVAPIRTTRIVALRTAATVDDLRQTLQRWYRFYSGYDPQFTWWAKQPYERADS